MQYGIMMAQRNMNYHGVTHYGIIMVQRIMNYNGATHYGMTQCNMEL
jgi:hypothetical protein